MADIDTLKTEIKKLNAQATQLKMDLHDLSEELPIGWEHIPKIAEKIFQAYQKLTAARQKMIAG
jgi:hypothetical protein